VKHDTLIVSDTITWYKGHPQNGQGIDEVILLLGRYCYVEYVPCILTLTLLRMKHDTSSGRQSSLLWYCNRYCITLSGHGQWPSCMFLRVFRGLDVCFPYLRTIPNSIKWGFLHSFKGKVLTKRTLPATQPMVWNDTLVTSVCSRRFSTVCRLTYRFHASTTTDGHKAGHMVAFRMRKSFAGLAPSTEKYL
jgi:hypothetical protein